MKFGSEKGWSAEGKRRGGGVLLAAVLVLWLLSWTTALPASAGPIAGGTSSSEAGAGGEASLKLPDIGASSFLGVSGRTLLTGGLIV